MIDVYCTAGTFSDKSRLAQELASGVMRWDAVPEIPLFAGNPSPAGARAALSARG